MYRLHITQKGIYDFYLSLDDTNGKNVGGNFACGFGEIYCNNSAIHTGLGQSNLLTVIARGVTMYLYVNGTYVFSASDTNSVAGFIGVFANDCPSSADLIHACPEGTDVMFNDAKIWILAR